MKEKELQLVTIEQAKKLKKLGFDYSVDCVYASETDFHNQTQAGKVYYSRNFKNSKNGCDCADPTVALALMWIRKEKKKNFTVNLDYANENGSRNYYYQYKIESGGGLTVSRGFRTFHNPSAYEECERALLDKLLTILEEE
jgi:hypothetical protein